ncbi:hypothetical protein [Conexibacter woesei]|uniref:hypothetical protein n=1 Tax=Conexibacter woesei TaxID=191495 RepID=UPI0003F5CA0E|nr:hypothetical protein [Conexibacter woesei]
MGEVLHLHAESRDAPVARLDLARAELTVLPDAAPVLADPIAVRRLIDHERFAWQLRVASP